MRRRAGAALVLVMSGCAVQPGNHIDPVPAALIPRPAPPIALGTDWLVQGAHEQGGWLRGKVPRGATGLTASGKDVPLADGNFFIGIDRDAPARLHLVATGAAGQSVARDVTVAPRAWAIERVNAPLRGGVPSETYMAIRRPELAAIEAARAKDSESAGWTQSFVWPVTGRISGRFGSQRIYQGVPGSYHSGLDIAPGAGVAYVAPADGVVVLAASRPFSLEGNLLIVDHGMGLNSAFLHSSRLAVKEGDRVRQGQLLGYVGATGRATGPHLHWSLEWQDARLDPLLFLPAQSATPPP